MAQATNTFDAYDSVGIREELSNMIALYSRTETPVLTLAGEDNKRAGNATVEWQKDALPAASDKKAVEGDVFSGDSLTATSRLKNYCQIVRADLVISGRADVLNTAGRRTETGYQIRKNGRWLKNCMENTVTKRKIGKVGNSTTAPELAGIPAWVVGNQDGGTAPTLTSGTPSNAGTAATSRVLSWAKVVDAEKDAFEDGGRPDFMPLPPSTIGVVVAFLFGSSSPYAAARNNLSTRERTVKMIGHVTAVTLPLQSSIDLVPDVHMDSGAQSNVMLLDHRRLKVCFLPGRRYAVMNQGKNGDAERKVLLSDFTLKLSDPESHAVVNGIDDDGTVTA